LDGTARIPRGAGWQGKSEPDYRAPFPPPLPYAGGSLEDAAAFLKKEYEQWGRVIREAGIRAD
jgi:hypothetical protein